MAIEVNVESRAHGGLRLIGKVPGERPGRLEGRNGIGKSALIRLLVLMSGVQPYQHEPTVWRSLKELVGSTVITVTGMQGRYSTARLQLTPDDWPKEPPHEVGDWLGMLELDGEPAHASELFPHLDVVHLVGTERLKDTFDQQYARLGTSLRETQARLLDLEDERAELGELADELAEISPRTAEQEHSALVHSQSERLQLAAQIESLAPRVEDLLKATALRALLDTGDAAAQEQRLRELREALEDARATLQTSELQHEAAVTALNNGSKAQRDAAKIERNLRALGTELDQLSVRQTALGSHLESVDIAPDAEQLDEPGASKLAAAIEVALVRQREAQLRAAKTSRSDAANNLVDELRVVLESAMERGLGDLPIAALNGEDVTVADLAAALGRLSEPDETGSDELAGANREVSELAELKRIFVRRDALKKEEDAARASLQELGTTIAGHDALREAAEHARDDLAAASAKVRVLNMQIGAATRSGLGGADVTDAENQVSELLARQGVAADTLGASLAEAQAELARLRQRDDQLRRGEADLTDKAARRRVRREALRRRAQSDPTVAWLAQLAATFAASINAGSDRPGRGEGEWTDDIWQHLSDHLTAVRIALSALVRDVGGLEAVAKARGTSGPYAGGLRAVIEQDALEQLSIRPVADALFDGGTLERVSMEDDTVTWRTQEGEIRTRPLAAFSSGQQALGFMRAKLEQIAGVSSENRLVFLDEFGAFIAADRRRPLAELLTSDALRGLTDQVIVVLPLQVDYEAELDQTTGLLHATYERRAHEVADVGYFTEVFDR